MKNISLILITIVLCYFTCADVCAQGKKAAEPFTPSFKLIPTEKFYFNNFVDCNMAEAWVADTFRLFSGKYGEDTLWGNARDLKFASGIHPDEAFSTPAAGFIEPKLPKNVLPTEQGLHGAIWFETVYQDKKDASGRTLYAVYHNENYPWNFPYNETTGEGYIDKNWPKGITGEKSPAAVCRMGIMKSTDGGWSWENRGIFLEDKQPRMTLKPHNTAHVFAGGVGDPSAVADGNYLYLFYSEYGYPGKYNEKTYSAETERKGQCISVARILLSDLDNPLGKAKRWDGKGFNAPYDGTGKPIASIQIQPAEGGGPQSKPAGGFHWGPSVSWNTYLNCWVMMMGKSTGDSWAGSSIYISFNKNKDLGKGTNSQAWTKPKMVLDRPGYFLWYPSLQPMNTEEDMKNKNTCLRLGKKARLFIKYIKPEKSEYLSEYIVEFKK